MGEGLAAPSHLLFLLDRPYQSPPRAAAGGAAAAAVAAAAAAAVCERGREGVGAVALVAGGAAAAASAVARSGRARRRVAGSSPSPRSLSSLCSGLPRGGAVPAAAAAARPQTYAAASPVATDFTAEEKFPYQALPGYYHAGARPRRGDKAHLIGFTCQMAI